VNIEGEATQTVKKIFFIHIAKTAGSSFNLFLKRHFEGEDHCEQYLNPYGFISEFNHLRNLDYISGHLGLDVFIRNGFPRNDYFLITFWREPIAQLISHLNWVMGVYDFGPDFFNCLHTDIQKISHELRAVNLYNTDNFVSTLAKFKPLFQNYQSSYFKSYRYPLSPSLVIERMSQLNMVGLTEYYGESLKEFLCLNGLNWEVVIDRENVNSTSRIKKDILENDSIYEFIQNYNSLDIDIYNHFLRNFRQSVQQEMRHLGLVES
jgi:Galactose-3-O-sulfotransferase